MLRITPNESLSSCELDVDRWTFVYLLNARGSSILSVGNRGSGALHSLLSRNIVSLSFILVRIFLAFGIVWFVNPKSGRTTHQSKHTYKSTTRRIIEGAQRN